MNERVTRESAKRGDLKGTWGYEWWTRPPDRDGEQLPAHRHQVPDLAVQSARAQDVREAESFVVSPHSL